MKKSLFIILSVLFITVNAQEKFKPDIDQCLKIKERISKLDSITARSFADSIAYYAKTEYLFYKVKVWDNRNLYQYLYIPSGLTKEEEQEQIEFGCSKCMRVEFKLYFEGANEDLEIEGLPYLVFQEVRGKFLDLYPTWKREFLPSATEEQVLGNFRYRIIYKGNNRLFEFSKYNGVWKIRNY